MTKEITYRNIACFGGLLLIIGLFINFSDPYWSGVFDIFFDTIALTTFIFAYLWIKRRVVLIGLLFYVVDFNIGLLINPILPINSVTFLTPNLRWVGIGFNIIGYGCLILGLWDKFENKYLTVSADVGLKPTLIGIVLFTGFVQTTTRLI